MFDKLNSEELPDINLYMDQVLTLIDNMVGSYKVKDGEKAMTKTMVNNYVKANLIDKPVKKKYSKHQLMQLVMIYYLKNVLSLDEIDGYFDNASEYYNSIEDIFKDFSRIHGEVLKEIEPKIKDVWEMDGEELNRELTRIIIISDFNKRIAQKIINSLKA